MPSPAVLIELLCKTNRDHQMQSDSGWGSNCRSCVLQLLIDGKFVDARSGKVFGTEDPRTGAKLVDVAEAQKEDVDDAVKAARKVTCSSAASAGS